MTDYTTLSDEQLSLSKEAIEAEMERRANRYNDAIRSFNHVYHASTPFPNNQPRALIAAWPHMPETKALQEKYEAAVLSKADVVDKYVALQELVKELEAVIAMHRDGPMADLIAGDADLIDAGPDFDCGDDPHCGGLPGCERHAQPDDGGPHPSWADVPLPHSQRTGR